eukprot:Sspe_Gene.52332::Locus_29004_Transcript_1_1_Confidence_1.000_Length_2051::g.52332::m.52332/K00833/bioA; adenosylmethionine---8-amino-7-oxononanoate aminotransferase
MFAMEHAGVRPDIMCIGKALTGGYMTMGAVLTTPEVARSIPGPLMHGPTFMANPLAASVALASVRKLQGMDWESRVTAIEQQLKEELEGVRGYDTVRDVRVLGAIGVVELAETPEDPGALQSAFVEHNVWLRPFGRLVYCMPPYTITQGELRRLTDAVRKVVARRW